VARKTPCARLARRVQYAPQVDFWDYSEYDFRGSTRKSQELVDTPETLEEKARSMRWSRTARGLTDAGFRGSGDGQRVPRVGTLLATRSATLPGAPRSPVHQLNMTVLRSPPSPSDLPAPLTTAVSAVPIEPLGARPPGPPEPASGRTTWASRRSGPATLPLRPRLAAPVEADGPAPDRAIRSAAPRRSARRT
jgi:hypothetical protein